MDISPKYWPEKEHVFIFDNATTHKKREGGALSTSRMPKGPSAAFGIDINKVGADGKPVCGPDGKVLKTKTNGKFADGREHEFYYPKDMDGLLAGQFKGMAKILEE